MALKSRSDMPLAFKSTWHAAVLAPGYAFMEFVSGKMIEAGLKVTVPRRDSPLP